jgi:hypothetical protein
LFFPDSYVVQERVNRNGRYSARRGAGPGKRRLFHGAGWDDALVMPYYDIADRICGILFVARNSDPQNWEIASAYKRCSFGCSNKRVREAGVAMLPVLAHPFYPVANKVFLLDRPGLAFQLYGRWIRDHTRPLPIVLAHFSPQVQNAAA